jgi:hypothetical protein
MGADPVVARAALHFGEEPCISGTRGSGTVFFSGCSLRCSFCQNRSISREGFGRRITPEQLADIFRRLTDQGAHNINLVTATHFVPAVIRALDLYRPPVPVVYNCGGYESVNTLRMLEGYIDIYLPDLKYMAADPARRYSAAADYPDAAQAALLEMDSGWTLERYGQYILQASGLSCPLEAENGSYRFTYEAPVDGATYTYIGILWEGDVHYWMVQIYCPTEVFAGKQQEILNILDSLT